MTPQQVLDAVDAIAATSSIREKQDLLGTHIKDSFFLKCMVAAYHPLVTYGMKDVPTGVAAGEEGWTLDAPHVWNTLDELAQRRLTGDAARNHVQMLMNKLDSFSAELLWRIIRKDMRAGFGETLINKVRPHTLPDFPYMRCSLPDKSNMDKWDWSKTPIISQVKADGMFVNVNRHADGSVTVRSRQGSHFSVDKLGQLETIVKAVLKTGTQTHGELLVYDNGVMLPREQGNGVLNSVLQGGDLPDGHVVAFYAWDQIPLFAVVPKGSYKVPYKERLRDLIAQVANQPTGSLIVKTIETRIVHSKAQAYEHYRDALRRGLEGTICKHPDTIWKDGTSKDQVKLKMQVDVDLKIVGYVQGEGKNATTFGSITCRTRDDLLQVDVSGFTDAMRQQLWNDRDKMIDRIMTVRANSIMRANEPGEKHSLFLPRYVELRSDKTVADSFPEVEAQFKAAITD